MGRIRLKPSASLTTLLVDIRVAMVKSILYKAEAKVIAGCKSFI